MPPLFRHRHRLLGGGVAIPVITGVTPAAGAVGDPITITGINFGAARGIGSVVFTNTAASFSNSVTVPNILSWSDTQIVVKVPNGVTFPYVGSFIRVTTNTAQGASSAATFLWTGGAANFASASAQFLAITDGLQSGLNPGTSDFTIAGWVNSATLGSNRSLVCKGAQSNTAAAAPGYWLFVNLDGTLSVRVSDNAHASRTALTSTGVLSAAAWSHVAITFARAGNMTAYVNAVAGGTQSIATIAGSMTPSADFAVGCASDNGSSANGTFALNGAMDGLGFWTRSLSGADITSLYNGGSGISYASALALGGGLLTNLAAWWDLDDAGGSGATWVDRLGLNNLTAGAGAKSPTSVRGVR